MKKWILTAGGFTVALVAAVAVTFALAGSPFADGGSANEDSGRKVGGAPLCAQEAPDCEDTLVETDGDGGSEIGIAPVCVEEVPDCEDVIVEPGVDSGFPMCLPDAPNCSDAVVDPDEPVTSGPITSIDDIDPNECNLVHNITACELQATAAAVSDLATRLGVGKDQIDVVSRQQVEWSDTSLGNPQPDMFYAQVITPGFQLILQIDGQSFEYHTDTTGQVTLLP